MSRIDQVQIREIATAYRAAIERCDRIRRDPAFVHFPAGSCGDATLLLARHLIDRGISAVHCVLGYRGAGENRHSHAWLLVDDIIVDITADQFPEVTERIIVARKSDWHRTFILDESGPPGDYREYDSHAVNRLDYLFNAINRELENQ